METSSLANLLEYAAQIGTPQDQMENFLSKGYIPQPKQLQFHHAARLCDSMGGPDQVGFGGSRGPGKSHAIFAQVALDDCRRQPGLKALYLRKVAKQAKEQFEDLRRSVLRHVPHTYNRNGLLELWEDSRIFVGHFKDESDVDNYLGIEYDLIVIEETTTLTTSKYQALRDSNRSSKDGWRPRIYNSTNPGSTGHYWYKKRFVDPWRKKKETYTRFIPATIDDNAFIDEDYKRKLEENTGWRLRAYRHGDWDIAAGQFFTTWNHDIHVVKPFHGDIPKEWPKWASMDYGFTHPTVFHIFTMDGDGNIYVIMEHSAPRLLPPEHGRILRRKMKERGIVERDVWPWVAGVDVFAKRGDSNQLTIAEQYERAGIHLTRADVDRMNGWSKVLQLLGDSYGDPSIEAKLFIFDDCDRIIEQMPSMVHSKTNAEDVLKVNVDDEGNGGDDAADCLRYGLMATGVGATASEFIPSVDRLKEYDEAEWTKGSYRGDIEHELASSVVIGADTPYG
jgi:hypothetical protein